MRWILVVAVLLSVALSVGCKSHKPASEDVDETPTQATAVKPTGDYVKISKSGCLGQCSIFDITVWRSGQAEYRGIENVPREGYYTGTVNSQSLASLWAAVDAVQETPFEAEYEFQVMDVQGIFLSWEHNGETRKVRWKHGEPRVLTAIEKQLDAIANAGSWTPK